MRTSRGEIVTEFLQVPWLDWAGGGTTFTADGKSFWSVRPGEQEREIELQATTCDDWRVVATGGFEAEEDGDWILVPHPECNVVGLWIGAGQDGQWLYWSALEDRQLLIEEEPAFANTGPPTFHPAGSEFLTDSLDDGLITRRRFPDGKRIGVLSEKTAWPPENGEDEPDRLGGISEYVSNDRAIILSANGRLWLIDLKSMCIMCELLLEGALPRPFRLQGNRHEILCGDVEHVRRLDSGRLLTVHRDWIGRPASPEHRLKVWDMTAIDGTIQGPDGQRPHTEAFISRFFR